MLIVFVVSGFWHGANWTFIVWGTLHGLLMIPLVLLNRNRDHLIPDGDAERLPSIGRIWDMGTTFLLWSGTLIFFRAENIGHAWRYLREMTKTPFLDVQLHTGPINSPFGLLSLLVFLIVADWLGRGTDHSLTIAERIKPNWMRYALYYSLIISLFYFATEKLSFIYFQF
jgi:alginate O-acetyltransferase complex protein AlgI